MHAGLVLRAGAEGQVPSSAAREGGRVDHRRAVMILDKGSGSRSNERSFCKHASLPERAALCVGAMFAEFKPGFGSVCKHSYTSCEVYDTCLEARCKCESSLFPYFISYGKKYCERFLASTNWSSSGASWRDKTLVCLQEKIVLMLPTNALPCDCKALKAAAFQIHVACYTQPNASVCDLGLGDWITIYKIIDNHDLFADPDGRAQMLAVARICGSNHPDGPLKDIFNKIINALK